VVSVFRDTVTSPGVGLISVLQAGAFWGAVLLPFVYLPLVFVGLDSLQRQLLFASLVSLNIILLIVGHTHRD
jgi:hypothetical protein